MERVALVGMEVGGGVESPARRPNYPLNKDLTALVLSFLEVEEQRNFSQISIDFYRAAEEAILGDLRGVYKSLREFVQRGEGGSIPEEVREQIQRSSERMAHGLHQEELGCEEQEALVYRELITLEQGAYDSIQNELSRWPKVSKRVEIYRQSLAPTANRETMLKELISQQKFHIAKTIFDIIEDDEFLSDFAMRLYNQIYNRDGLESAYKVAILIKSDKRKETLNNVYNKCIKVRKFEMAFSIAKEHMKDWLAVSANHSSEPENKIYQFTDIPTILAREDKWSQALESIPYVMRFSSERRSSEGEAQWRSLISLATFKGEVQKEMLETAYDWLKRRCEQKEYADGLLSHILKVFVVYHDDYRRAEEILLAEAPWSREIENTRQEISGFRLAAEEKFDEALERINQIPLQSFQRKFYFYNLAILAARKRDKVNLKKSLRQIRSAEFRVYCLKEAAHHLQCLFQDLFTEIVLN